METAGEGFAWHWSQVVEEWVRIPVLKLEPEWEPKPGDTGRHRPERGLHASASQHVPSATSWPRRSCVKSVRGYQRILSEPEKVISEQRALAEGVMG